MTTALVTGAGGQDGGYLVEQLVDDGVEVHTLGLPGGLAHADVFTHVGDVTEVAETRQLVLEVAPDAIYNLAAISSVARSWCEPELTAQVNGAAAVALMESALRAQELTGRAVHFVQASSAEIFGNPDRSPQDESTPIRPVNPYGASKAYAHLMAEVYRRRGLHASSLVLYNHESPRRPRSFVSRKITSAAVAIAAGDTSRLTLGNLQATRDWGWAPDHVQAMRLAATASQPGDYVVATGQFRSVEDFVRTAFHAAGLPTWEEHVDIDPGLFRPAEGFHMVGDATLITDRLGWAPTVTFDEIVARMVDADVAAIRAGHDLS